jgi:poly-gamma-glutamate system protein
MSPEGRTFLESRIRAGGVLFLEETDLAQNVEARMRLYRDGAGNRPIKAFVNIGGSWANIGTNAEVLKLRPGLASGVFVPPPGERGVLQAMAARHVPIIHLLNVKGLCERYGLPWDPRPLPAPGRGGFLNSAAGGGTSSVMLSAGYVLLVIMILVFGRRRLP